MAQEMWRVSPDIKLNKENRRLEKSLSLSLSQDANENDFVATNREEETLLLFSKPSLCG